MTPYSSSKTTKCENESRSNDSLHSGRLFSAGVGTTIGLFAGLLWTLLFGPMTDGPPSIELSLLVYTSGFAFTGFTVGVIRIFPVPFGTTIGFLSLSTWAIIVGPKDGWVGLWIMLFGGSGLVWGATIGGIYWYLYRFIFTQQHA